MALVASGVAAGLGILSLLLVFSLARGLCSVVHKDVLGKTVPKTRRGRLAGLSATAAGVLLGRKTYVVDMAAGNRRTDYVAVSNTTIGVLLLGGGLLGLLVPLIGVAGVVLLLSGGALGGGWLAATLPEVETASPGPVP